MTKDIYFTAATAMEFVFESATIRYHVFALDLATPLFEHLLAYGVVFHQYLHFLKWYSASYGHIYRSALIGSPWMGPMAEINAKSYFMMLGLVAAVVLPLLPSFVHGQLSREMEMEYQSCQM